LSNAAREAREFGIPEEIIAKIEGRKDDRFEVWAENWATLEAFLFVSTQWRVVNRGGGLEPMLTYWIGLDYAAAAAGLAGAGIETTPEIWNGLRVMESAARNVLNGNLDTD